MSDTALWSLLARAEGVTRVLGRAEANVSGKEGTGSSRSQGMLHEDQLQSIFPQLPGSTPETRTDLTLLTG